MTSRFVALLLCAAAIALACAPRARSPQERFSLATAANAPKAVPSRTTASARSAAKGAPAGTRRGSAAPSPTGQRPMLLPSLELRTDTGAAGPQVRIALHVTNPSADRVEIAFTSGLTHEVVVIDEAGHEVWRWSADRMFTQAMQTRMLDAGETLSFEERWTPAGRHGTYTIVASLPSSNYPVVQKATITIP